MSERPTPETDAFDSNWDSYSHPWQAIQLARKLESERDVANEELSKKYIEYDKLFDEAENIRIERDEALRLGNKLADECERILGLGMNQNTLLRFKNALKAWRENT